MALFLGSDAAALRQTHVINAVRRMQKKIHGQRPNCRGFLWEARQRDFITTCSGIMAGFYEPRTTIFSRVEGHSRRCRHSEFVAAQRHLNPRRPANCDLRTAGPSGPIFDERRTTYDERPFPCRQAPKHVSLRHFCVKMKQMICDVQFHNT